MSTQRAIAWCMGFALAAAGAASAQSQTPTDAGDNLGGNAARIGQTITISGCLQTEREALGRRDLATGADELVLTDAGTHGDHATGGSASTGESGADPGADTTMPPRNVYVLTGDKEDQLQSMTGQRVEITGRLERTASEFRPVPGASAGGTAATAGAEGTTGEVSKDDDETKAGATNTGSTLGNQPGFAGARSPQDRAGIEAARLADSLPLLAIESFRKTEGSCPSR